MHGLGPGKNIWHRWWDSDGQTCIFKWFIINMPSSTAIIASCAWCQSPPCFNLGASHHLKLSTLLPTMALHHLQWWIIELTSFPPQQWVKLQFLSMGTDLALTLTPRLLSYTYSVGCIPHSRWNHAKSWFQLIAQDLLILHNVFPFQRLSSGCSSATLCSQLSCSCLRRTTYLSFLYFLQAALSPETKSCPHTVAW